MTRGAWRAHGAGARVVWGGPWPVAGVGFGSRDARVGGRGLTLWFGGGWPRRNVGAGGRRGGLGLGGGSMSPPDKGFCSSCRRARAVKRPRSLGKSYSQSAAARALTVTGGVGE
jgi:hypothetical protein